MNATRRSRTALAAVKTVHTLIWFSVEAAVGYLLVAGLRMRSDRREAAAGVVVAGESLIYLANKARCPLTGLAESLGAESGSVTDIYLPSWFARNLPAIHVPVIALVVFLHGRNMFGRRRQVAHNDAYVGPDVRARDVRDPSIRTTARRLTGCGGDHGGESLE